MKTLMAAIMMLLLMSAQASAVQVEIAGTFEPGKYYFVYFEHGEDAIDPDCIDCAAPQTVWVWHITKKGDQCNYMQSITEIRGLTCVEWNHQETWRCVDQLGAGCYVFESCVP